MRSLLFILISNLIFVGCDFTHNKTTKDQWGSGESDSSNGYGNSFGVGGDPSDDSTSDEPEKDSSDGSTSNESEENSSNDSNSSDTEDSSSDNSGSEDSNDGDYTSGGEASGSGNQNSNDGRDPNGENEEDEEIKCSTENMYQQGLKTSLFALKQNYISRHNSASIISILKKHKLIHLEDYMSTKIDTAPRSYNLGVVGREGEYIVDPRTEAELLEQYVIKYEGEINILDDEDVGRYEFALLSDDGVLLKLNGRKIIKSKKLQAPKLNCGRKIVQIEQNKPIKLKLYYHQGPRNHVANMLMWRKVEDKNHYSCSKVQRYKMCGKYMRSADQMLEEGWEVVPSHVLRSVKKECVPKKKRSCQY